MRVPGPFTTVFGGIAVLGLIGWFARNGVVVYPKKVCSVNQNNPGNVVAAVAAIRRR